MDSFKDLVQVFRLGQPVRPAHGLYQRHPMPGGLKFRGDHIPCFCCSHGEGHQRGRDGEVLKAAGHGILAADGGDAQALLGLQRAKKRRHGPTPLLRVAAQMLEILLKAQVNVRKRRTCGDEL